MTEGGAGAVRAAREWSPKRVDGVGPFTSRLIWRLPEGGEARWESRRARKRGTIAIQAKGGVAARIVRPSPPIARRLRRVNWVAAGAFTVGGSLFALGAAVAQFGSGDAATAASIYFAGGLFFSAGAYASLVGAINAPRSVGVGGTLAAERWRWWSYMPERIDWLIVKAHSIQIRSIAVDPRGRTPHDRWRQVPIRRRRALCGLPRVLPPRAIATPRRSTPEQFASSSAALRRGPRPGR